MRYGDAEHVLAADEGKIQAGMPSGRGPFLALSVGEPAHAELFFSSANDAGFPWTKLLSFFLSSTSVVCHD
jgi:hypothetical protein